MTVYSPEIKTSMDWVVAPSIAGSTRVDQEYEYGPVPPIGWAVMVSANPPKQIVGLLGWMSA